MPPRRTKAAKKDAEATENEGGSRRKSGRAVSKPETPAREASRSRRGTTVAQTAVSVADSKTPRARGSSRRDSASSSDLPASRTKAARRSASQVNYEESDEELANAKKVDENFSGEDFEESDSDESSKPKKRGKAAKSPAKKGRGKGKSKASPRKGRGRPSKKKRDSSDEDEEEETVELSDDSGEVVVTTKKTKTPPKTSSRGRRQKVVTEIEIDDDEKPKSSRRSARGSTSREEPAKKRPSRNVPAKRYTDDDVEEIEDVQETGEMVEGTRKRKRGSSSPEEASKRLKEDVEGAVAEDVAEKKETEGKQEEAMEVDEPEVSETKTWATGDTEADKVDVTPEAATEDTEMKENSATEKDSKPESAKTPADVEEGKDKLVSEEEPKAADSEPKVPAATHEESKAEEVVEKSEDMPKEISAEETEVSEPDKLVKENVTAPVVSDQKPNEVVSQVESVPDPPSQQEDVTKYDSSTSDESKPLTIDESRPSTSPTATAVPQPNETNQGAILNGSENNDSPSTGNDIQKPQQIENSTPTANGSYEGIKNSNSVSPADQYFSRTGRKYIMNTKLSDGVRQSVKDKTFGFVSYNLGTSSSDIYMQKEKLLNELNSLDARIICLQQVAKPFFYSVLEPSLDALGFKSMFYLPTDSLKGIATFYKSSLFRPTKKTEISLKHLVEKELESSSLSPEDRAAVKTNLKRCGNVLFIQFDTVIGTQSLTIANVQIPPTDLSMHALQVSCLAREVVKINGGTNVPLLLGGEFNVSENDASYQLLRDGYLSNDMIEELQRRKDIALPGKENESLVNLLWNLFQHMSSNLNSCYKSVLGHEFFIPETKKTSPDLLWFSSNSLQVVGVLDAVPGKPLDHNFSLKADVAFSV
ncbi:hypothetical protein JTE90_009584 [Oedothorax gibbosus]|uniref:Endonuclease/exonuclease/phosphatase domain-containing protein n=1 Tax=Oedothorax gibbosus TaxID=931172 RepID=A0AAV6VL28_9ARAC|nr:hypothetical protein JTE90_009584 [Oedothorax gibbosus]